MRATANAHHILVSAALVQREAAIERALSLRALPPARFREPVRLRHHTEVVRPRRGLTFLAAALALTSLAIAGWNAYCLAAPLRDALASLFG